MLAMVYFKYLESNKFLDVNKTYLFGDLLMRSKGIEETFLVVLEMLRLYFPAGTPIDCPGSHQEFLQKFGVVKAGADWPQNSAVKSEQDIASVKLLTRLFSLLSTPKHLKQTKLRL
jgi:hypothetical protein